ncbi:DHHA1 domain-containing protein, partial [Corynebacterium matruchotii]
RALVAGLASALKAPSAEVPDRIAQLTTKLKEAEKTIENLRKAELLAQGSRLVARAHLPNGIIVASAVLPDGTTAGDLRTLAADVKNHLAGEAGVVLLASSTSDGKVPFVVAATKEAIARGANAGTIVKTLNPYIDGRGGGKPDMAQGSGSNPDGLPEGLKAASDHIATL